MIDVEGLTKRYASRPAVCDLSFTVHPGRVTGFLGPNGAGKSTTMRMIVGLEKPTSGCALVAGRPFRERRRGLREVGALLNASAIHGGRSARDHVCAIARSNGIAATRADVVLALVGLGDVAAKRVGTFSLGMRQRLGIAVTLLGDPAVLLFDEPFNGLDPEGIEWARGLMRALAARGRTVFVASHLVDEMARAADHLLVLGRGRLIADEPIEQFVARGAGTPVVVAASHPHELAELLAGHGAQTMPDGDDTLTVTGLHAEAVGQIAAANGIAIRALGSRTPSLQATYLELTDASVQFREQRG